jgi:cadmium resistance protein CadD (predicted permease)
MDLSDKPVDERIERETAALELERHGEVAITVGKALLGMDLILVCFVEIGFRTGSFLFSWWVAVEGLLGLVLIIVGMHQKSEAQSMLANLEPTKIA